RRSAPIQRLRITGARPRVIPQHPSRGAGTAGARLQLDVRAQRLLQSDTPESGPPALPAQGVATGKSRRKLRPEPLAR
ncbi:MAG TPA: hypothetical protein VGO89_03700, partial [Streptomyces sp.]|nr:hypothetical protein [Streptomyces sp.]